MEINKILKTLKDLIGIPSYLSEDVNERELGNYIYSFLTKNTNLTVEKQQVEIVE